MLCCLVLLFVCLLLRYLVDAEFPLSTALWGYFCIFCFFRAAGSAYVLKSDRLRRLIFRMLSGLFCLLAGMAVVGSFTGNPVLPLWFHLYFLLALSGEAGIMLQHFFARVRDGSRNQLQVPARASRKLEAIRLFQITSVFLYLLLVTQPDSLFVSALAGSVSGLSLLLLLYFLSETRIRIGELLPEPAQEDAALQLIQERLVSYFQEKKPYLKPDLKINDVALAVFTNKTYVSRVLNESMNMNFNQYVNSFRIREAQRIYRENPGLKMNELSEMCGFRTIPSFYKAFRDNVGDSPANWCRGCRSEIKKEGGADHEK